MRSSFTARSLYLGYVCAVLSVSISDPVYFAGAAHAQEVDAVIDFSDFELEPDTVWAGPPENAVMVDDGFGGEIAVGSFVSGGGEFPSSFASWGWSSGFTVSNRVDVTTPGWTSGTSAITGSGDGDANYAVAFGYLDNLEPSDISQLELLPYVDLPEGMGVLGASFANTTNTALSILQGDSFAKKFGGETGDDPDFLALGIFGSTQGTPLTEAVEFMLADYRSANNDEDYLLTDWTRVDLSSLAEADRLYFNLRSSDSGDLGMNTPAYFAIDQIQLVDRTLAGDFDGDGLASGDDIDLLCAAVNSSLDPDTYDMNADGELTADDVLAWLDATGQYQGDVNLDGEVEFGDFLVLSAAFGLQEPVWTAGDLNCDGDVAFADFLSLSANFGLGSTETNALAAVPEPTAWATALSLVALLLFRVDRKSRQRG